jgi:hypothetical protein
MSNLINMHTHPLALSLGLLAHTIQALGVLLTCLFKVLWGALWQSLTCAQPMHCFLMLVQDALTMTTKGREFNASYWTYLLYLMNNLG